MPATISRARKKPDVHLHTRRRRLTRRSPEYGSRNHPAPVVLRMNPYVYLRLLFGAQADS